MWYLGTLGTERLFATVSHLTSTQGFRCSSRDSDAAVGEEIGPRIFSFVDYIWN